MRADKEREFVRLELALKDKENAKGAWAASVADYVVLMDNLGLIHCYACATGISCQSVV